MLGIRNDVRRLHVAAIRETARVSFGVSARACVEFVELLESAQADDRLRVGVALAIGAREGRERAYLLPDIFREVVVAEDACGSLQRIAPEGEALRADDCPHGTTCDETLGEFL